jgi:prevent-host-death family protein
MAWQLQDAKQRFSELVRMTLMKGPQVVTRHGEEVVVLLPAKEYRRLTQAEPDFKAFLLPSPDFAGLEIRRADGRGPVDKA